LFVRSRCPPRFSIANRRPCSAAQSKYLNNCGQSGGAIRLQRKSRPRPPK
jgi:hypothetical protein